jgi:hypothetical protein
MGNTSGLFAQLLCPVSFLRTLTTAYCALLDRFRIDHAHLSCLDRQPFLHLHLHLVAHRRHSLSYFYIVSSFFGFGSNVTENTVCPNITSNDTRLPGLNVKCLLLFSDFQQTWNFSTDWTKNPQHKMSKQSVYWDPRGSTRRDKLILCS